METALKYITADDKEKIKGFLDHYARRFFAIPSGPLYHYTTGENLVRIIESQEIWSTQVSCLNDTKEAIYAVEQLHIRVKARLSSAHSPELGLLLKKLDELLSHPAVESSPAFVTCFSERRDDLSQWRAYAGGEGGYAIQFDQNKLRQCGFPKSLLVRVEYEASNHSAMFDDIIKWSELYFWA